DLVLVDDSARGQGVRGDRLQQLAGEIAARLDVSRQYAGNWQIVERHRHFAHRSIAGLPDVALPTERRHEREQRDHDEPHSRMLHDLTRPTCPNRPTYRAIFCARKYSTWYLWTLRLCSSSVRANSCEPSLRLTKYR